MIEVTYETSSKYPNYLKITLQDTENEITISGAVEITPDEDFRSFYNWLMKDLKFKLNALRKLKEQHPDFIT